MTAPEHGCPGCDRTVPNSLVACRTCWRRLPQSMRSAIWRAIRHGDASAHMSAVGAALGWYRTHPSVDKPGNPRLF